ncbi:MAG: hypothetical protein R3Y05_01225 [bacterium]
MSLHPLVSNTKEIANLVAEQKRTNELLEKLITVIKEPKAHPKSVEVKEETTAKSTKKPTNTKKVKEEQTEEPK